MNLETKWLEDFSTLATTRSFSQAAEKRFVTQPAFSRRIRSLEDALGLTLVNRQRTPIELTEAGQLFLVTARAVVEQLGQVVRHLHHLEGGQGEVLQFAAAHSLALGFFPAWIARLRAESASPLLPGPIRQRLAGRAAALEKIAERHARTRITSGDDDARR